MRTDLRARLAAGDVLVADGATGTQLQARGLTAGGCSEQWNLDHPDLVTDVAKSYADAGSDLINTNSFGGNRWRLARYGLADRLAEINEKAAVLARAAAHEDVYVMGAMGPSGEFLAPLGTTEPAEIEENYAAQAKALVTGGVDTLLLETFSALEEITAAARGVRSVTDLPLFCTLTYGKGGRTMMGVKPEAAAKELLALGADVVGLNCGDTIDVVIPVIAAYKAAGVPHVEAKPNAGMPEIIDGKPVWPIKPPEFGERAKEWLAAGAQIIGGCCGTSPDYVRELAKVAHG